MADTKNAKSPGPSPGPGGNNNPSPPKKSDESEEQRLKETLLKKKITQKKIRRQGSGGVAGGGAGGSPPDKTNGSKEDGSKAETPTPKKKDEKSVLKPAAAPGEGKKDAKDTKDPPAASAAANANANGEKRNGEKKAGVKGDEPPKKGANGDVGKGRNPEGGGGSGRARKRRRRRDRRRGGGGGGGPSPRDRDFYHGPPTGPHRGDPHGRGPPPRNYYDDRRGGGGRRDDIYGRGRGGGGWRDDPRMDRHDRPRGERDGHWDGAPRGGWGGGLPPRRDDRDIYGRGGPPPPRGGGGGGGGGGPKKGRSRSPPSPRGRSYSRSPSPRSRSYSSSRSPRSRSGGSYSSRSRSRSRSYSRSRSRSYSRSPSKRSDGGKRRRGGSKGGSKGGSPREGGGRSSPACDAAADEATKDQRTVFVSQLVMRADERDISRYFKRSVGAKVRDVILLRDKRTGRHKGCAYVELGSLSDVDRALGASGRTPDFQRFPILVKLTESEKNAVLGASTALFVPPGASPSPVQMTADGQRVESQKVYVGSIDRCVTQAQLYELFSKFGPLDRVLLQMDMTTGASRGFAFLSYRDPRDANLAIQAMSGQNLAGRPLKTGWANQQASASGVVEIRSEEFPDDMNEKIQNANAAMNHLTGTSLTTVVGQVDPMAQQALLAAGPAGALGIMPSAQLASVADAALDMALGVVPPAAAAVAPQAAAAPVTTALAAAADAKVVGRADNPSQHILVHNMFDRDEETDEGWEEDIKLDFEEECAQYGKITAVIVMSKDTGGKIYSSFGSIEGATSCAKNLAGRWFDKRQLRVEFVDSVPDSA